MTDYALSSQQIAVICALSSGATATEAAEQAGVHRNTVSNWRRNTLPFQYAFAHAQYDRALLFREKAEALADLAIQTIQAILNDPNAPAGVRLKAALAILQTVSTPPEPKKQIELDIERIKLVHNPEPQVLADEGKPKPQNLHNPAQPKPGAESKSPASADASPEPENVHNSAQPDPVTPRTVAPKTGRNETCPCGSGKKYKRCCLANQARGQAAAA